MVYPADRSVWGLWGEGRGGGREWGRGLVCVCGGVCLCVGYVEG